MPHYSLHRHDNDDPPLAYDVRAGATLGDVLGLAAMSGTVDVYDGDRYLVSYCGESPYWYDADGIMHQIGSRGWCHDCHGARLGYVHHLDYEVELAILAHEAEDDRTLARQCEADGMTPAQYADSVAGRAVPLDGDHSFEIGVHELGADADGLAVFAVDMWDMTTWRVRVEIAEGAPERAAKLAESLAYHAQPKRCWDCRGRRGHAGDCSWTRTRELLLRHPDSALPGDIEEYGLPGAATRPADAWPADVIDQVAPVRTEAFEMGWFAADEDLHAGNAYTDGADSNTSDDYRAGYAIRWPLGKAR
jgi:hypothetical protein